MDITNVGQITDSISSLENVNNTHAAGNKEKFTYIGVKNNRFVASTDKSSKIPMLELANRVIELAKSIRLYTDPSGDKTPAYNISNLKEAFTTRASSYEGKALNWLVKHSKFFQSIFSGRKEILDKIAAARVEINRQEAIIKNQFNK